MVAMGYRRSQLANGIFLKIRTLLLSDHFALLISLLYLFVLWLFILKIVEFRNLANISFNMRPLRTLVIGQVFVPIMGGIDLSETAIMAVTGVLGGMVMSGKLDPALFQESPPWGAILSDKDGLRRTVRCSARAARLY